MAVIFSRIFRLLSEYGIWKHLARKYTGYDIRMATIKDVVLIYLENEPVSFARVEDISPDAKKDWYHVKLLMFQIPIQMVTWILKDDYIGGEPFYMNGKQMKLVPVEDLLEALPPDDRVPFDQKEPTQGQDEIQETGEIISFADLKKNREPDNDAG